MKIIWTILFLTGFLLFNNAMAQRGNESLYAFIQNNIDSAYKKESLPGIFVGILNNGEKHFFNAGFADPEKQMSFDAETLFETGSITKTFTAYILTAVLMKNKIPETDPVIKYLPDTVQQNQLLNSISFLSLMNHTSGLPRLPGNLKMANARQPYENYTASDLFTYLKNCTPKPDGKSNYSNLGAGVAGVLAERISGKSYAALLDQYIFIPFKMVTPGNAIAKTENKSQGYFAKDDKTPYWNMGVLTPAGGLTCTGSEMLTYLQNMCYPVTDNAKAIVNVLTTETVAINPKVAIGRGWHILTEPGQQPVYWHNGGTYGFSTFCAFAKNRSKAVIVVVNQYNKNAFSDGLGIKIIKKMTGEE